VAGDGLGHKKKDQMLATASRCCRCRWVASAATTPAGTAASRCLCRRLFPTRLPRPLTHAAVRTSCSRS
jgi:hypothetical protein